jgi:hypothetical protein
MKRKRAVKETDEVERTDGRRGDRVAVEGT